MTSYTEKTNYAEIPDATLAAAVMAELEWHRQQDNFIQGIYWTKGKGCAVSCLLKGDNHAEFPSAFGITEMLARLDDKLFEGLPLEDSKQWPIDFMGACMKVGITRDERLKKLQPVGWQFLYWLLTDELPKAVIGTGEIYDNVRKAIAQCADVLLPLIRGEEVDKAAALAAAANATNAADGAANAVAAARAAYATADAVDAARAADAADYAAAYATAYAADATAYKRMAEKLLELIEATAKPEVG